MLPIPIALHLVGRPRLVLETSIGSGVSCVRLAPDAKSVLAVPADGGNAVFISLPTGSIANKIKVPGRGRGASYSFASNTLITVHENERVVLTVDQFKPGTSEEKHLEAKDSRILVHRSGEMFALASKAETVVYSSKKFEPIGRYSRGLTALEVGKKVAVGYDGEKVVVMDHPSGKVVNSFVKRAIPAPGIALAEADHRIYMTGTEGTVMCIDIRNGKTIWTTDYIGAHDKMSLSPNNRFIAIGNMHGGLVVLNTKDGKEVFLGGSREMGSMYAVNGVDWSADGRYLAGGYWTGEVKVWDMTGTSRK